VPTGEAVWRKVRKPRPGERPRLAGELDLAARRRAVLRELGRARVAFRDVSRATDARTVRACFVPPRVLLTNKAPTWRSRPATTTPAWPASAS
jgi:ribosomal protein S14